MSKKVEKSGAAEEQKVTPYNQGAAFAEEVKNSKAKADAVKAACGRAENALDAVLALEGVCKQGIITFFNLWGKFNEKLRKAPEGDVRITLPFLRKAMLPPLYIGHTKMSPFVRGDQAVLYSAEFMMKKDEAEKGKPG